MVDDKAFVGEPGEVMDIILVVVEDLVMVLWLDGQVVQEQMEWL